MNTKKIFHVGFSVLALLLASVIFMPTAAKADGWGFNRGFDRDDFRFNRGFRDFDDFRFRRDFDRDDFRFGHRW